ncbi:hypothetical protein Pfo_002471 [Paulownia fortunei]|nr:hypothetical protein Pfo_002471 [Paulownia fortunei]
MGYLGLLKCALLCIDLLAWPVVALGYPLFASIRAIETGSKYHMRKLVTYWTLFSLIYLFEFAFLKIIEWIPFWSRIKLIATFWLVMPQFDGACHAYQSLIRPYLVVNLQTVINGFYEPKEEQPLKKETFLGAAEKYIKENGSEALEKLIASQCERKEPDNSKRDTQVLEPNEKNAAAKSEQLKEPGVAQKNNDMLEATDKSAATEAKQLSQNPVKFGVINVAWVPKVTDAAAKVKEMTPPEANAENRQPAAKVKEMIPPEANAENRQPAAKVKEMIPPEATAENRQPETPPLKKVQQEWTCVLCQVTTASEKTLNAHLQGKKHKSKCEFLKSSKLNGEDTGPSPSATGESNQGKPEAVKGSKRRRTRSKRSTSGAW